MSTVAITALPAVTSSLAADVFPVVQSGVTSKITNTNLFGSVPAATIQNLTVTNSSVVYAPTPATFSGAVTLTNTNLQTQILVTSGLSYTLTMPLGTTMETLVDWKDVNLGFDFSLINVASGTVSLGTNTGVTNTGILSVPASTSGRFRIRRTAANTFVLYRLS
jgi:hypothetical protein